MQTIAENISIARYVGSTEIRIEKELVPYEKAIKVMERRVEDISAGKAPEMIWFLEHPPLISAGTSARLEDLLEADRFPVHKTGRGGQFSYHGPGQRVVYAMLNLGLRGKDIRKYVNSLEEWVIQALATFNVNGQRRPGRVGIWIDRGAGKEDKIAAIGVRVRHWVAFHGISINVEPDLSHFEAIVPCGISDSHLGVTSLVDLGLPVSMHDLDVSLIATFEQIFSKPPKNNSSATP